MESSAGQEMEIPDNVTIVTQPVRSRKLVQTVLCDAKPTCMPIIFKMGGLPRRQISAIGLEFNGRYIIFDLRACPNLVLEGHLYRLLISPDIVKVIHSTGAELLELSLKHNIITRCLFDTHKAFDYVATFNQLPLRRIGIACLQAKLNHFSANMDLDNPIFADILSSPSFVDGTGLDWNKRPLTTSMSLQIVAEVDALKKCYLGLCGIGSHFKDIFHLVRDIPEEASCSVEPVPDPERQEGMSLGIRLGLLDIGQSLLTDTIPLAEARNIPSFRLDV